MEVSYGEYGKLVLKKYFTIILIAILIGSCTAEEKNQISKSTIPEDPVEKVVKQESILEEIVSNEVGIVKAESIEDIRSNFGFKLIKIIDVQITDPEIKRMMYFVGDDNIVVSSDPYTAYNPLLKAYFLYDIFNSEILDKFIFNDIKYAFFKLGENQEILYSYGVRRNLKYESYDLLVKESKEIEKEYYDRFKTIREYEDFGHLRGSMDYQWAGYSLNPWRELRNGQGIPETYASDEYTIGMFCGKKIITPFPYVRVVTNGQFNQSPDGKYLAFDAGFYRNDIYRDSPPSYYPKARYVDKYSGSKYDFYQYAVFIYEAVTEENIEILDDQRVEVLTFPNPEEAAAGITEVKRHTFDGSHLNVTPGEAIFWGTAIRVHDGTMFYREPNLDSEIVKEVLNEGRIQIIVDRAEEEETINPVTDYWYFLEDQYGERGWVFGDSHFDIVEEMPWFLKD